MVPSPWKSTHTPVTRPAAPPDSPRDHALWGILLTNAVTLFMAIWQDWSVLQLLWPFWIQSLIIGWYARRRILSLTRFCTAGVKINDRAVEPTPETQRWMGNFFALHFGFFHFVYLIFLLAFTLMAGQEGIVNVTMENTGEVIPVEMGSVYPLDFLIYLALAAGFWTSHGASHREHVAADLGHAPNIGVLMMIPYARVIPMHLCIILAAPLGGAGMIWFFILLKTGADVVMHVVEHRVLQRGARASAA